MASLTGYWIGEATGTNKAGFAVALEQEGDTLSGTARVSEPSLGIWECVVTGQIRRRHHNEFGSEAYLNGIDLGLVTIVGRIMNDCEITGKWSATIGAEGVLTMKQSISRQWHQRFPDLKFCFHRAWPR